MEMGYGDVKLFNSEVSLQNAWFSKSVYENSGRDKNVVFE